MNEIGDINPQRLAAKMQAMAAAAQNQPQAAQKAQGPEFSNLLVNAIDKVNELQKESGRLRTAYEIDPNSTNLVDVMIAGQKSGLAFTAMVQTRNKLIEAYRQVMSMPV